jgi:hypothetical protein
VYDLQELLTLVVLSDSSWSESRVGFIGLVLMLLWFDLVIWHVLKMFGDAPMLLPVIRLLGQVGTRRGAGVATVSRSTSSGSPWHH